MGRFKEFGKRRENLSTQGNYWQQDITASEKCVMASKAVAFTGITAWLYYHSLWAMIALTPIFIWEYRKSKEECERKKRQKFLLQFKEMIQSMAAALGTGYSVENAMKETQKELKIIYSQNEIISKEMAYIIGQIRVQVPVEQILEEFACRVGEEDVKNFASVFSAAKRNGGDMIAIIQDTVMQMSGKIEVKREIDTILAAKRYELKVMSAVPYLIIAYMSFSFPEFMSCLYGNLIGIGVMTICLSVYMGACALGEKLIHIEV